MDNGVHSLKVDKDIVSGDKDNGVQSLPEDEVDDGVQSLSEDEVDEGFQSLPKDELDEGILNLHLDKDSLHDEQVPVSVDRGIVLGNIEKGVNLS